MSDFLKAVGILCWIAGGWLILDGFFLNVIVDDTIGGTVANFQLMHIQQLDILLGALAFINGSVCLIGGLALGRMPKPKPGG